MRRLSRGAAALVLIAGCAIGFSLRRAAGAPPDGARSARGLRTRIARLAAGTDKVSRGSIPLSGKVSGSCVGGSGRYLFLAIPERRRVEVFDADAGELLPPLSVETDKPLLAAGHRHLFVIDPEGSTIERFDLVSFQREARARLPFAERVRAAWVGSESVGPLVVGLEEPGRLSVRFPLRFVDPVTFSPLELRVGNDPGHIDGSSRYFVEGSRDGRLLGLWHTEVSPTGLESVVVSDSAVRIRYEHDSVGPVLPGPDGRTLHTLRGNYSATLQKLPSWPGVTIPAASGPFGIVLPADAASPRDDPNPRVDRVSLFELTIGRAVLTLSGVEGLDLPRQSMEMAPFRQRLFAFPSQGWFVTIPLAGDRLCLRRFDLERALDESGIDYLLFSSEPPRLVEPGRPFEYRVKVLSRRGQPKIRLESGPPGMALDGKGVLRWTPADAEPADVLLSVSDASGRQIFQTFRLTALPGGPG